MNVFSAKNCLFSLTLLMIMIVGNSCQSSSKNYYLLAGTYTKTGSKGIYVYSYDADSAKTVLVSNTDSAVNPSYIVLSGDILYAVNETGGDDPGRVSAYSFDKAKGQLTFLNSQLSGGDDPCFVSVTKEGKWVAVGNYSGGNFSVFPVKEDGSLQPAAQTIQHEGSGPNKDRQSNPHVHATVFSPGDNFLLVTDLGLDKIMVYKFDKGNEKPLQEKPYSEISITPGGGPRHITFSNDGKYVYLVRELDGMANVFEFDNGELKQIQEIPMHPEGQQDKIDGAEIVLSPDNKFLYISNRGNENSLSIFSVDETTKKLASVGYQPVGGKNPRNFIIDPSGNYLLVANQDSNDVIIFKRDKETGLLEKTDRKIDIPMPVCLKIVSK